MQCTVLKKPTVETPVLSFEPTLLNPWTFIRQLCVVLFKESKIKVLLESFFHSDNSCFVLFFKCQL